MTDELLNQALADLADAKLEIQHLQRVQQSNLLHIDSLTQQIRELERRLDNIEDR